MMQVVARRLLPHIRRGFSTSKDKTTHFGFQEINESEKVEKVGKVFHDVADSYDMMNDAMSFGIHRRWKDQFVDMIGPVPPMNILDVAGGTGDIAFRLASKLSAANDSSSITVCDINSSMLRVGQERWNAKNDITKLQWVEGNAESLEFEDEKFDLYTIAFGIRNVTHIDAALSEAHRVLKPGGRFMCLEFSHVNNNPVLSTLYDTFSFYGIPNLGAVLANDRESYQYLVESIRKFPNQDSFQQMIQDAGFSKVHYTDLTGGIVSVHSGFKL